MQNYQSDSRRFTSGKTQHLNKNDTFEVPDPAPVSFGGFSPPSSLISFYNSNQGPGSLQLWSEKGRKKKEKKRSFKKLFLNITLKHKLSYE